MDMLYLKSFFEDLDVEIVNVYDSHTDSDREQVLMIDLLEPIKLEMHSADGIMFFECNGIDYQKGKLTFFMENNPIVEKNVENIIKLNWNKA